MDIFLLSNGRLTTSSQWLNYATTQLQEMFQRRQIRKAVLVPYAVLRGDHDQRASELSQSLGIEVVSIAHFESPVKAIESAECILVSGGNTWWLNKCLHEDRKSVV